MIRFLREESQYNPPVPERIIRSASGETPTGKQVTFHGMDWISFKDGKATGA